MGTRILVDVDDLLFNSGDLRLALEAQVEKLRAAVEAEPEDSLKQADADEWAAALAHHFAVACPELQTDDVWREPVKDVKVDVSWDRSRYLSDSYSDLARNYPGYRVIVHIPFEGDAGVFSLRPSSFNFNPPRGRVRDGDLVLTIEYARDSQPNIDGEVNSFIGAVSQWIGFARGDIDSFNRTLEQQARQAIEGRRQRIEQRDAHLAQSSIPQRRPGESGKRTYIPDVLVRRPAPSLPETRADDKPPTLEPVLDERVFEHILRVIRMQAGQMEQSPGTYRQMGEEDRRQTIVATPQHALRGPRTRRGVQRRGEDRHPHPPRRAEPLHLRVQVLERRRGLLPDDRPALPLHRLARHQAGDRDVRPREGAVGDPQES
jgi:hypothetical protein